MPNPEYTKIPTPSKYAGIPQELLLMWDLAQLVSEMAPPELQFRAGLLVALVIERVEEVTGKPWPGGDE